jgi:putative membrane protein insertion efficiency factor
MKRLLIGLLRAYQLSLAAFFGGRCRFHPSCSAYAMQAVQQHGVTKGAALAAWRVCRCGPWPSPITARIQCSGFDPVPKLWQEPFSIQKPPRP